MAGTWMSVHVTNIDSVRCHGDPSINFWARFCDQTVYLEMKRFLEVIRPFLENRPPPIDVKELGGVFCVLINHDWQRARLLQAKFSHAGTLKIFCIDYGDTHVVPLTIVRTLDIPGIEAEHVRNWPPLATKCRLADVVAAPVSLGSDQTMMFMKVHAQDRTWKAAFVDIHDDKMGMRLCNSEKKLLATLMIEQDVGIPTCTYSEALNMMQGFTYSAGDTKLIEKVISLKTQNCISVDVTPNQTKDKENNKRMDEPKEFYSSLSSDELLEDQACVEQSSLATAEDNASKIISSTGDSSDVFVPFDGIQFEDSLVTLSLEAAQVIEPEEVLEKHDAPVQEEGARKAADALYDERIALQIKTGMKSNEGETPKGNVYVSHIASPGDFWIQHIEDEQNIGVLEDGLVEVGTSNQYLLSDPPIVGQLYVAKHPEFGYWYRAKLLKLDQDIAEVIFFDYGDKQNLPVEWIRRLSQKDQCIPPMAVRCKLSAVGLDVWPDKATEVMRTLCPPECVCRIVFKNKTDPIFEVDSLHIGDIDVVEAVLSSLECEHPVGSSPQTISQPLSPSQSQSSLTGVPQVDAQLFFIRLDPETEFTNIGQEPNEDENRLLMD